MKCLAVTHKGCEEITAIEIKEILDKESELYESCVSFSVEDLEEVWKFSYLSRSVKRVIEIVTEGKVKELEDLTKGLDLELENKTFAVRCKRIGYHDFKSLDVEKEVGGAIKGKVNLEKPDVLVYVYIYEDDYYIGFDHIGIDLSKRGYHIFNHPTTVKGSLAYCLVRMSGYEKGETFVDTFSRSGGIPLEAALYASGKSTHFFDKQLFKQDIDQYDSDNEMKGKVIGYDQQLKNVKAAQKNAKIAGINKEVSFLRGDIEWLDTKFKENEVDRIVSYPPQMSNRKNPKELQKIAIELWHQIDFVLKDSGKVVLLLRHSEVYTEASEKYGFKLLEERSVFQGQDHLFACVYSKKENA